MNKAKPLSTLLVMAAATVGALTASIPAQATVAQEGCSFTANKPAFAYKIGATKYYRYTVRANCAPGLTVNFTTQAREQDGTTSELLGSWNGTWKNWKAGEVRTWSHTLPLTATDHDQTMELFHRVRFRVTFQTGDSGSLSPWDVSAVYPATLYDLAAELQAPNP